MKIGYIGLGALGNELARRFLATHEVLVWDLNPSAAQRLGQAGALVTTSASLLAQQVDVLLTCLPRSSDVRQLLFGSGGIAEALKPGSLVIDQTSGVPQETNEMAQRLGQRGVSMLDAAVSASPHLVPQGLATLMVSGPDDAFARALPLLREITSTIYHCGTRVGDGQAMKMVNNAMNAGVRMGTLELVALGRKAGLSLACITEVLNRGGAANITTERMLPAIAQGRSATNFALALMLKDLNQAVALGLQMQVPMPLANAVRSLLQIGLNLRGDKALLEEMIGVIETMAGTHLPDTKDDIIALADPATAQHNSSTKIGVYGLNGAGAKLAQMALRSQHVYVYDERPERVAALESQGAVACPSLGSLAEACEVLVVSGESPSSLADALISESGIGQSLAAGQILIDLSSVESDRYRALRAELRTRDVMLLEARVVGDPPVLLYSGAAETCARLHAVPRLFDPEAVYCGATGNADAASLINNALAMLSRHATFESVATGFKFGLSLQDMAAILPKCSGWSTESRKLLPQLASGDVIEDEQIELVATKLRRVIELAMVHGSPITMTNSVNALFASAINLIADTAGTQSMLALVENSSGVKFRCNESSPNLRPPG